MPLPSAFKSIVVVERRHAVEPSAMTSASERQTKGLSHKSSWVQGSIHFAARSSCTRGFSAGKPCERLAGDWQAALRGSVELTVFYRITAFSRSGRCSGSSSSIGRIGPPCRERQRCAAGRASEPGLTNPGEHATMCVKRSPLARPMESPYDAPSENPPIASRSPVDGAAVERQRQRAIEEVDVRAEASRMPSHVPPRDSGEPRR